METILFIFCTETNLKKYSILVKDVSDCGYLTKSYLDENIDFSKIDEDLYKIIFTDTLPPVINNYKYRLLSDLALKDIIEDINRCLVLE